MIGDSGESVIYGWKQVANYKECQGTGQKKGHPHPTRVWEGSKKVALRGPIFGHPVI